MPIVPDLQLTGDRETDITIRNLNKAFDALNRQMDSLPSISSMPLGSAAREQLAALRAATEQVKSDRDKYAERLDEIRATVMSKLNSEIALAEELINNAKTLLHQAMMREG